MELDIWTGRILLCGCGVQSVTAVVLMANGKTKRCPVLFSDTGSEDPRTETYITDHLKPFCEQHRIGFYTCQRKKPLHEYCAEARVIPIKGQRWCTDHYKIRPARKWIRKHFSSPYPVCGLCFTLDEIERWSEFEKANQKKRAVWRYCAPLLDLGLTRADCIEVLDKSELPRPPKSGCWLCPYQNRVGWARLKQSRPDLFKKAVELEENSRLERQKFLGARTPLNDAVSTVDLTMPVLANVADAGCSHSLCGI